MPTGLKRELPLASMKFGSGLHRKKKNAMTFFFKFDFKGSQKFASNLQNFQRATAETDMTAIKKCGKILL